MKKALHAVVVVASLGLMNPVLACDTDTSQEMHMSLASASKHGTHVVAAKSDAGKKQQPTRPYIEPFE